jgi:3-oxoacyl-[acyl-carrier-protein] synthase III
MEPCRGSFKDGEYMRVISAVVCKPELRPVAAVRAEQPCNDYWFLVRAGSRELSPGSRDLVPMPDAGVEETTAFQPPENAETSIAESITEIGQLAADATQRLKEQAPSELLRKIDVVIVCTTGIDAQFGVSLAGKVQYILGASGALPFAIGQMDGCSSIAALRIARAFMNGPERARVVAIVATECWLYPYFRSFGDYAQYGDGAAAVLLCADHYKDQQSDVSSENHGSGSDIDIGDVALGRYQAQQGPFDLEETPWYRMDAWPQAVGDFLADFLRSRGIAASDLARIHSPGLNTDFIQSVAHASGLSLAPSKGGFVSSVDPLWALQTPDEAERVHDGLTLCWSVGLNGEMGAYLSRRSACKQESSDHAPNLTMNTTR